MANMIEVTTTWNPPSGVTTKSVMYFGPGADPSIVRLRVHELWDALSHALSNQCSWSVDTEGRILDSSTGTLLGSWTEATTRADAGIGTGQPVADATQALLRWQTGTVVSGRFLQGRTFVPGLEGNELLAGNLGAATVTSFVAAQASFLLATSGQFGIWHRPKAGAGGVWVPVTGGSTASELAVLRRRRNPM